MNTDAPMTGRDALVRFFTAPIRLRSYANLLFLMLSFPLGIFYFVFLVTGLSVGIGLTIVWVGLPILALVFAVGFGLAAVERQMAIHLLGARVPPMAAAAPPEGFWNTVQAFLSNPVTWKGLGYLLLKLPLGVFSFVVTITLMSVSTAFILAPVAYQWGDFYFMPFWQIDTLGETFILSALGVLMMLATMNLLNLLAAFWREVASLMLGSDRFAATLEPPAPAEVIEAMPEPTPA